MEKWKKIPCTSRLQRNAGACGPSGFPPASLKPPLPMPLRASVSWISHLLSNANIIILWFTTLFRYSGQMCPYTKHHFFPDAAILMDHNLMCCTSSRNRRRKFTLVLRHHHFFPSREEFHTSKWRVLWHVHVSPGFWKKSMKIVWNCGQDSSFTSLT